MNSSRLRFAVETSLSAMALGGIVVFGTLLPQQAKAQQYPPAYIRTTSSGAYTPATNPDASVGFFFDVQGTADVYGLGFAAQTPWETGKSYTVKLWSYVNSGINTADYTEIASIAFTGGNSYTLENDYYWQTLASPKTLADSDPSDFAKGYFISAIGDFSNSTNNKVQYIGGSASFDSRIVTSGNAFSTSGSFGYPLPNAFDAIVGNNGYFNANLSFAPIPPASKVPSPLPLLGAAAGFSWSRRLRKRISASN